MKLNATNVDTLFRSLLFKEGEDHSNCIKVDGVLAKFGLHPVRVKEAEPTIIELLSQLPDEFKFDGNQGGSSFLRACLDKDGNQWAEHAHIEQLIVMGIAVNRVKYYVPREYWRAFPGGMPVFMVLNEPLEGSHYLVQPPERENDETANPSQEEEGVQEKRS